MFPTLFACADDDGHAEVLRSDVEGPILDSAARAVRECPERAITLG